jgi:hypothetical protein
VVLLAVQLAVELVVWAVVQFFALLLILPLLVQPLLFARRLVVEEVVFVVVDLFAGGSHPQELQANLYHANLDCVREFAFLDALESNHYLLPFQEILGHLFCVYMIGKDDAATTMQTA